MRKFYLLGVVLLLIFSFQTVHASTFPNGCTATTKYSATTGQLCSLPQTCNPGDLFNSQTGQPCPVVQQLPPGCTAYTVYSPLTGQKCSNPNISVDPNQSAYIQSQTQLQTTSAQANNAATLAESKKLNIEHQIQMLQDQVTVLQEKAFSDENAYQTGSMASYSQAQIQQIANAEKLAEAPLDAQIAVLQAQLQAL